MTVGSTQYKGMAVPLRGECDITQITAATDFITLTGAASISGDFLVCRGSTGTEYAYITSAGKAHFAGGLSLGTNLLRFSAVITTALATTALGVGDMYLVMKSSTPQLAVQIAAASTANVLKYFTSNTATFGRASTT